ncbi:MAG: hypothetical protein E7305_05905 [Butyrivibrio sp.]|jgi:vacuolar-type H+-ATPase subunit I/STV1|nr:hypothetical protein [Butyrivibrio sp.]MBE5828980.1 hypothetical protein [Butyrivibrio sp.]MBP3273442.1 hypothetical protein [Butyrivibrio sp.]
MSDTEMMAALLGVGAAAIVVALIICLVVYLVDAIGIYKYLKARNYSNAWFGFIPFLNTFGKVDATYGNVDKIKVFGVALPAIVVKLYPVILVVFSAITSRISAIASICSLIVTVLTVAVGTVVFKDVMERIEKPVSTGFAVFANIITIVGSIKLLADASKVAPGQYDYTTDTRVLASQAGAQGPANMQ